MILGRNAGLWTAAIAAIINVAMLLGPWTISPEGWAAINAALFAFVGLVANEADQGTVGTFASTFHAPTEPLGATTDDPIAPNR